MNQGYIASDDTTRKTELSKKNLLLRIYTINLLISVSGALSEADQQYKSHVMDILSRHWIRN